jgi:hypothetical protein
MEKLGKAFQLRGIDLSDRQILPLLLVRLVHDNKYPGVRNHIQQKSKCAIVLQQTVLQPNTKIQRSYLLSLNGLH